MLSFRSISVFAALACATFSSAVPLDTTSSSVARQLGGGAGGIIKPVTDIVGSVTGGLGTSSKRGAQTPNDLFQHCTDAVQPIVVKLKAAIKVDADVDVDVKAVVDLLGEVVVAVKVVVDGLGGCDLVGLDVKILAGIVWGLISLLIEVLCLVVQVVGFVDGALVSVLIEIGGLLVELLTAVFAAVDGLKAALILIVDPVIFDKIAIIKYVDIVAFLKA